MVRRAERAEEVVGERVREDGGEGACCKGEGGDLVEEAEEEVGGGGKEERE